jgi:hypothetical protein
MDDRRFNGDEKTGKPVPKDLPDQQASGEEDPLDVDRPGLTDEQAPDDPDQRVPDTEETGTGRRGAPPDGGVHPDQPVPDEPSG